MRKKTLYNKELISLLYKEDYKPQIKEVKYTGKLGYSTEVMDILYNVLSQTRKNERILAIAPTGSGKTYGVSSIFDKITEEENALIESLIKKGISEQAVRETFKNTFFVILCPNKIQNQQNQTSYNFKAVVSGVNVGKNDTKLSCVYEKAEDILALREAVPNAKIVMVVDEAHNLLSAINYREQAINNIFKLEEVADTVLYITATPDPLQCFKFSTIYNFVDTNYKGNTKKLVIRKCKSVKDTTNSLLKSDKDRIFAIGDRDFILTKERELKEDGKDVNVLISTEEYKTLDNPAYFNVINNDKLLNGTTLVTSMFYAGTNITDYSKDLEVYYSCFKYTHMDIDNIEQYFNRFRGEVELGEILVSNKEKEKVNEDGTVEKANFLSLNFIVKNELEKVNRWVESYKLMVQALKMRTNDKKYICNSVRLDLDQSFNGRKNNLGCIDIDENTLEITFNKLLFFKYCYCTYMQQYYYFPEKLQKELENRLNIKAEIVEDNVVVEKKESKKSTTKEELLIAQIKLEHLMLTENKVLDDYLEDNVKAENEDLNYLLKQEKLLNKLQELLNVGVSKEVAYKIVLEINNYTSINKYILLHTIVENNIKIINKNLKEIGGQLGNVQIYLYNNIKVRSRLTDKKLKELVSGVNKEFKTKITDKKLLDIIKNMYKVTDKLYISSLRKRT